MHSYVTRRQNGEEYEEELEKDFEETLSLSLSLSLFERIYFRNFYSYFVVDLIVYQGDSKINFKDLKREM